MFLYTAIVVNQVGMCAMILTKNEDIVAVRRTDQHFGTQGQIAMCSTWEITLSSENVNIFTETHLIV